MKANSERVKQKNFRDFHGKPLFRWILDTLLSLEEISAVVINTDARSVLGEKGLTESGRVVIRDRKPEICGDLVSMNLVLADDVANVPADVYLMTHTTNPLLGRETIREALAIFMESKQNGIADSLFTVNKFQTRFYREDCTPINHDPDNLVRTQELEPWFEENSNLYLFTRESFLSTNARIGKKPLMFETPRLQSVDIDDQTDWDIAEIAAQYLKLNA
jgi:CMP-N-acetylneuraminic acid synthetase